MVGLVVLVIQDWIGTTDPLANTMRVLVVGIMVWIAFELAQTKSIRQYATWPLRALDGRLGQPRLVRRLVVGPDIVAEPTSGPSPEIRLGVTNKGEPATFRATARIVAQRNDPNAPRHGTYALQWIEGTSSAIDLDRWQHGGLLIAHFKLYMEPQVRMGEARLIEWTNGGQLEWSGFRWIFDPKATEFPEQDLDITITSSRARQPLVLRYTLRPADWIGPLELVARLVASTP